MPHSKYSTAQRAIAENLYDFLALKQEPVKADLIMGFGHLITDSVALRQPLHAKLWD